MNKIISDLKLKIIIKFQIQAPMEMEVNIVAAVRVKKGIKKKVKS